MTKGKIRQKRRETERQEIQRLEAEINELEIEEGTVKVKSFCDLPISQLTLDALNSAGFTEMTDIQRMSIIQALKGKDILGAAKTGSGKTLAFLIPLLELLFRNQWNPLDGLGALIITPTRELAIQIFDVLRDIGSKHSFSAGLVIGGKDLTEEQGRIHRMNILVCTPGRLLQHMDQTVSFDTTNLKLLVLDEADRILDMGFAKTLNAIVENLPRSRQTMLFSATQTKSVQDLARLSLKDPEYIAVHEKSKSCTPEKLEQSYVVCTLPEKLDLIFSFIKSHLHSKTIMFFSSCKQVRFVYESFCKLQPGIPLLSLHGKQKQVKRMGIYGDFCRKKHAVLMCTDIAARGLDFPMVDWVVQVDCPEDVDTYIHRVGRTARYESSGRSVLILLPSEEPAMQPLLENRKIPIKKIKMNPSRSVSVTKSLQAFLTEFPDLKYLAQKAFISYIRSVFLQKNKQVFRVNELPLQEFAASLGLAGAPKVKFIKTRKDQKNASRDSRLLEEEEEDEEKAEEHNEPEQVNLVSGAKPKQPKTKMAKMFLRKNTDVLSEHYDKLRAKDDDEEEQELDDDDKINENANRFDSDLLEDGDDDFLVIKRQDHNLENVPMVSSSVPGLGPSRRDALKNKKRHQAKVGERGMRTIFDDEGRPRNVYELESESVFYKDGMDAVKEQALEHYRSKSGEMAEADISDKAQEKERRRAKKLAKKRRLKEANSIEESENIVILGPKEEYNEDENGDGDGDEDEDNSNGTSRYGINAKKQKRMVDQSSEDEQEDYQGDSVEDQEALALHLLNNNSK